MSKSLKQNILRFFFPNLLLSNFNQCTQSDAQTAKVKKKTLVENSELLT